MKNNKKPDVFDQCFDYLRCSDSLNKKSRDSFYNGEVFILASNVFFVKRTESINPNTVIIFPKYDN